MAGKFFVNYRRNGAKAEAAGMARRRNAAPREAIFKTAGLLRLLMLLAALFAAAHAATAGQRVALVIGNGKYSNAGTLANPVNDAGDMAAALKDVGFTVVAGYDLDKPVAPPPAPVHPEPACDGLVVSVAAGKNPCIKPGSGAFFKDCPDCPEMTIVPEGRFTMGSPENEPEHQSEEAQHEVRFGKPFAVGRFAVTFAEWDACVADGGCGGYRPGDGGWGRDDRPVINVNWNDAKSYVQWLSKKTGKQYRLLSEAEREYAARAGTVTPFWWGSSISTGQANYDGIAILTTVVAKGEYREKTLPVKSFKPNPWGLYQVHGNVWEWVEDCWHDSYNGAPADGPHGQPESAHTVCFAAARGSSLRSISARPTATTSPLSAGAAVSVSALA